MPGRMQNARLRCRPAFHFRRSATLLALTMALGTTATAQEPAPRPATARVLIIRGIFNVFSIGLDDLGQDLRRRGYDVEMSSPEGSWAGAMRLREAYERDPQGGPLVIIGHSMGGRACLHIARYLQSVNIPVKLVIILDANPWVSVPDNVERCVNLYVTNPYHVFHGSPVRPEGSSQVLNYDVTKVERPEWANSVNHFTIHGSQWMHAIIVNEMDQAYASWRAGRAAPIHGAMTGHGQLPNQGSIDPFAAAAPASFAAPVERAVVGRPVSAPAPRTRSPGNDFPAPFAPAPAPAPDRAVNFAPTPPSPPPAGASDASQPARTQPPIRFRL